MICKLKNCGFSLTEVLIAVGILSVGMIFIAGVFPAGIYFTTVATERSIAAVVADEAFAKIKIYAKCDPNLSKQIDYSQLQDNQLAYDFNNVFPAIDYAGCNEFLYPSTRIDPIADPCQQYSWSALCRLTEASTPSNPHPPVQVTVFVCRKVNPNLVYYRPAIGGSGGVTWPTPNLADWPLPVKVGVNSVPGRNNELIISNFNEKTFINDGYTIVDNATGRIYRILERYAAPNDTIVLLDRNWDNSSPGGLPQDVWVVPPPVNGGRNPCISVYQKIIRF